MRHQKNPIATTVSTDSVGTCMCAACRHDSDGTLTMDDHLQVKYVMSTLNKSHPHFNTWHAP
jgi:hypothetical protein